MKIPNANVRIWLLFALLFVNSSTYALPNGIIEDLAERSSTSSRMKAAQNAKYHLDSRKSGARQFCINFLKSSGIKAVTTTTVTSTTTSTITPSASTASTTVFSDVTNTVTITTASTPSTTVTSTVHSTVTIHVTPITVTQTSTSVTPTTSMRRRSNNFAPLFSFSHTIIEDACLLFLYVTLQPPPSSAITSTATSTAKTTASTSVITSTVTSTRSTLTTVTTVSTAPTSTSTATVTGLPSTTYITDAPVTTTITQTVPPPRILLHSDQGDILLYGSILEINPTVTANAFNLRNGATGQDYALTSGNLYIDGSNNKVFADGHNGQLTIAPNTYPNSPFTMTSITCSLNNLDQSFSCKDDINLGYTTIFGCIFNGQSTPYQRLYLYSPGQGPSSNCQMLTGLKFSYAT